MADETDTEEDSPDDASVEAAADGEIDNDQSTENDADVDVGNGEADAGDGSDRGEGAVAAGNVVPIDVFEPLGRYRSYLKVLSTCVTEMADEAAASIGNYLRRPVRLTMGDIRVIGQANCQPENSLLNGSRNFFYAQQPDGYFYVGLTDEMVAYLVELFYGGAVETLSTEAASPGCLSEVRMRKAVGEFFSEALSQQLASDSDQVRNDMAGSQSRLIAVNEQDLIKQQYSRSMLAVMLLLESDGLKCELETGFCINMLEKVLGVSFSSSEPVAISDARWSNDLRQSVADCDLELRCTMAELPVRLGDVQKFKVGDFIPLADLDSVMFSINRRKLFQGQFGVVDDKPSASFKRWV